MITDGDLYWDENDLAEAMVPASGANRFDHKENNKAAQHIKEIRAVKKLLSDFDNTQEIINELSLSMIHYEKETLMNAAEEAIQYLEKLKNSLKELEKAF